MNVQTAFNLVLFVGLLTPALSLGQVSGSEDAAVQDQKLPSFIADFVLEVDRFEERSLALLAEIPAEKIGQLPREDAHSVGEVFASMLAGTGRILEGLERESPELPKAERLAADKALVESHLRQTMEALRTAATSPPPEDLEAPIDFLGRRWTVRGMFVLALSQMHEALGHASGHAEDLGIMPPWVRLKRISDSTDD